MNTSYFGDGLAGIGAAARGYLGKEPGRMTERKCALMAGLPNAPNALSADPGHARVRAELVLAQMEKCGLARGARATRAGTSGSPRRRARRSGTRTSRR